MELLKLESACRYYRHKGSRVEALSGVSLVVASGDLIAVTGPSGAGKTTLLDILGLMDSPDSGKYYFEGSDTGLWSESERAAVISRRIGFISRSSGLLPDISAGGNMALAMAYAGLERDDGYVRDCLARAGLAGLEARLPGELSAGQRQRLAVARALAKRPDLILADEPAGNLDPGSAAEVMRLLKDLNAAGSTILFVTHDQEAAGRAGRLLRIENGRVSEARRVTGTPAENIPAAPARRQDVAGRGAGRSPAAGYALKGLLKKPGRPLLTAVFLACAFFTAAYFKLFEFDKEGALRRSGADRSGVLIVSPAPAPRGGRITPGDALAVAGLKRIKAVYPSGFFYSKVSSGGKALGAPIHIQTPWLISKNRAYVLPGGRFFNYNDIKGGVKVIVLGENLAAGLFGSPAAALGKAVTVKGQAFTVSGVYAQRKSLFFRFSPDGAILPYSAALQSRFTGGGDLAMLYALTDDFENRELDGLAIAGILKRRHSIKSGEAEDFRIMSARCSLAPSEIKKEYEYFRKISGAAAFFSLFGVFLVFVFEVLAHKSGLRVLKSLGASKMEIAGVQTAALSVLAATGAAFGSVFLPPARHFFGLKALEFFQRPSGFIFEISALASAAILAAFFGTVFALRRSN